MQTRGSLLARLKDRDDSIAWQGFFNTYAFFIYKRARSAGLSDYHAQEVVQETVIAVAKKMPEFRYDPAVASFKTWLFRVVNCGIANQIRKLKAQQKQMDPVSREGGDSLLENFVDPASLEPDDWERHWKENLVIAASETVKKQVKSEHWQIYNYHVLQDYSVKETAADLNTNAATVYMVKLRVGAKMKLELKRLQKTMM